MITHLEPDILECEVKGALGSITMNKASGGDGIPVELFQILKDDAVKVLHSICQQTWKTQQWPQDWKRSIFIPISKKGNAKEFSNYHTMQMTPPYGGKWRRTEEPLDKSKRGEWKVGWKLSIQKTKIMSSGAITSWQIDGETVTEFSFWAPKSLQMVTAAIKLRHFLLGRKDVANLDSI